MPLPLRTASVRTTTTDSRKNTSRLARPTQATQTRKTSDDKSPKEANATPSDHINSSNVVSITDSTNGTQLSSRIPSPSKRDGPSNFNHRHQENTIQSKPPPQGHFRQRSAVLPPSSARQKYGHSRSISAVSVNTSPSPSNEVLRAPARSRLNVSQSPAQHAKPQTVAETRTTTSTAPNLRQTTNTVYLEPIQNELLQLSIVHRGSTQGLRTFERSIATSLAERQAQLMSVRADVQGQKQAFSLSSNILAIDSWLQQLGHQKTCQSVQDLSIAIRDLRALEQVFDGALAPAFDDWRCIVSGRDSEGTLPASFDYTSLHVVFEKELVPELQRFKQQVASSATTLASLPACPSDSSIFLTIQAQASLANCLLLQCQFMLQIGNQLVSEHRQWLNQEIKAAVAEIRTSINLAESDPRPIWDT